MGFIGLMAALLGVHAGCGDEGTRTPTTAVLVAGQSPGVPGRVTLDGSGSFAGAGRTQVRQTYTVSDLETGEVVLGPVVLTERLDQAALRSYLLPSGSHAGVADVSGRFVATLEVEDDQGGRDRAQQELSIYARIAFAASDSCDATCSADSQTNDGQIACTLGSGCFSIDLAENVMAVAANLLSSGVNEDTTMWIRACGAGGGKGTDNSVGGDGGSAGQGGFAQTITTVSEYESTFSTTALFYYLGQEGTHSDSGGSGGGSTIVASVEPQMDSPWTQSELVVLGGGGGGGGEGAPFISGSDRGGDGGAGGFAYSSAVGMSATGIGGSGTKGSPGKGGGGTGCTEGVACGGTGAGNAAGAGANGNQGFGGESGGSGSISEGTLGGEDPKGWTNGTPDIGDDGAGARGQTNTCDSGGGGGGFGGGGGGGPNNEVSDCGGGGGGGSYAAASTATDGDAPSSNVCGTGDGEVVITFNLDPGQ